MTDAVRTIVLAKGPRYAIVNLTNISDGTGESAVIKVALSSQDIGNGVAPTKSAIKEIQYSIQGFTSVRLLWDHTTDDVAALLAAGNGWKEYGELGMLNDPASTGGTGNLLLTTAGAVSGATYDITVVLVLS